MFEIAKTALQPADMAKLLSINRCTVSAWFNDKSQPHSLLRPRVDKLLAAIAAAVQAGDLPVPAGVKRRERGMYITQHLVKHLKAIQSA